MSEGKIELKDRILKHLRNAIDYVEKDSPVMADEEIMDAKHLTIEWFWTVKDSSNARFFPSADKVSKG